MVLVPPAARRLVRSRAVFAFLTLLVCAPAVAAAEFPYDRELILDAERIGRVKRMPMLIVSPNGDATLKLWCKDVPARVQISGDDIKIEPGPVPDAPPLYISDGQCSPERMQADTDMLAVLAQVITWQPQSGGVVLAGATTLKFRPSDH